MQNRFVRVSVITVILAIFYFTFSIEEVTDLPERPSSTIEELVSSDPDTIFNQNGYVVIGKPADVVLIQKKDSLDPKYTNYKAFARYKDDMLLVRKSDSGYLDVYKKFETQHRFKDYQLEVYKGKLKDPDFTTNPEAKMFKTRITDGCKEGINFAGHYTLIYWGCGTECQIGVIVDRKTGKIYDGYQTSLGAKFQADSKLIIRNFYLADDNGYFRLNHYANISVELWENNVLKVLD